MKKNIFIALLFIGGLTACSDNNEGSDIPDNPGYPVTHFSKIELKEVKEEPGAPAVTVTQTYDYSAGRFVAGGELFKIENATNVVYGDHQAVVTDEINNISTYTLDDNGYAISCVRQEMDGKIRSYTFDYLINTEGKYFLKNITETFSFRHKKLPLVFTITQFLFSFILLPSHRLLRLLYFQQKSLLQFLLSFFLLSLWTLHLKFLSQHLNRSCNDPVHLFSFHMYETHLSEHSGIPRNQSSQQEQPAR